MNGGPSDTERISTLLRDVLDEDRVAVKELARRLVGPAATQKQVENQRRYINKILAGEVTTPTVSTSHKLAEVLGRPPDTFVVRKPRKGERVSALEAAVSSLARRLEELADGLDELRLVVADLAPEERAHGRPDERSGI